MGFVLQPNLGALEIGFLVSAFLFGVLTAQTLIYRRKFPHDTWALKLLVHVIWLLEFGQLVCVSHAMYTITITYSGQPQMILKPPVTVGASFMLGSAIGPLVEAFYVSRLLKFSGRLYPALLCWALAFLRWVGWVLLSTHAIKMQSLVEFKSDYGWLYAMLLGTSATVDLIVAGWIGYFLGKQRNPRDLGTTKLLDRIILWTLQTGVITSMAFLTTLVCFLIMGEYLIWLALTAFLTKVSSNCLLASVNARSPRRHRQPASQESRNAIYPYPPSYPPSYPASQVHDDSTIGNIVELYDLSNHSNISPSIVQTASSIDTRDDSSVRGEFWAM